jgi:subtilisin family serine protease
MRLLRLSFLAALAISASTAAAMPVDRATGRAPVAAVRSAIVTVAGPSVSQQATAAGWRGLPGAQVSTAVGGLPATLARAQAAVARAQAPVLAAAARLGVPVVARYDTALNGLLVHATDAQLAELARAPGVVRVEPAPLVWPALYRAVPYIGAQALTQASGDDGTGAVVAVIDTGLDYTHADFGGPGEPAAYSAANAAPASIDDTWAGRPLFPTAKVVGGYDFVGSRYTSPAYCSGADETAGRCVSTPRPDPDPLDERSGNWADGHGTHVAGIVAGLGAGGVPSGVAPGASLVALKVFGLPASGVQPDAPTDVLVSAFEWCTRVNLGLPVDGLAPPRVDVINMSLGGWYDAGGLAYRGALAAARDSGIVVVAAAGNDGDHAFVINGPGTAPEALSVASTGLPNDTAYGPLNRALSPISDFSGRGPGANGSLKPDLAAPGEGIVSARFGEGRGSRGSSGTSMATPMVAGAAAVIIQRLRDQGLAPPDAPLTGTDGLGVSDVAGLLVNYASPQVWQADNRTQNLTPLARSGGGRVDLSRAARGTTIVRAGALAALNFGIQQFDDTYIKETPVVVRNLADRQRRFSLGIEFRDPLKTNAGVKYIPMVGGNPAQRINLSPNSQVTIRLKLEAAANQLLRYPIYGGQSAMNGDQRMYEAEYVAFLVVTEIGADNKPLPGGDVSRLPIYFLPRGTSLVQASPDPIVVDGTTGRGPVILANNGGQPGRAELFAAWAEDPVEVDVNLGVNIDHVGIRVGRDANNERIVEFALHAAGRRYVPLESEARIFIENDGDAAIDYAVLNRDLGTATGPSYNGQQAVLVVALESNRGSLRYFAGADLENRTLTLPVAAADLGFAGNQPIKLHAVIAHLAAFDDVPWDYIPDGGVDANGQITSDRLYFDEANLGFTLDRWSMAVAAEGLTAPVLGRLPVGGAGVLDKVLALFPQNLQRRNDVQLLSIVTGNPPAVPATPTPRYTDTPTPRPTATRTPLPTFTTGPSATTGPSPTATRTPRPPIPTQVDEVPRIYLPVARKAT